MRVEQIEQEAKEVFDNLIIRLGPLHSSVLLRDLTSDDIAEAMMDRLLTEEEAMQAINSM